MPRDRNDLSRLPEDLADTEFDRHDPRFARHDPALRKKKRKRRPVDQVAAPPKRPPTEPGEALT